MTLRKKMLYQKNKYDRRLLKKLKKSEATLRVVHNKVVSALYKMRGQIKWIF